MWAPHSQVSTCISFVNCVCLFEEEWLGEVCFLNGVINVLTTKASKNDTKTMAKKHQDESSVLPTSETPSTHATPATQESECLATRSTGT